MPPRSTDEPITIVVLGPMARVDGDVVKAASRTRKLGRLIGRIIADIQKDPGYQGPRLEVEVPEDKPSSVIVPGVLELIESAELVVIDVTGGRPNVAYEAGIVHALGLPHLFVTSASEPPFYFRGQTVIAGFACTTRFDPDRHASHATLRTAIRTFASDEHEAPRLADNQLTRFFELPLVDISGPSGLGAAYYKNSVRRFVRMGGYVDVPRIVTWVIPGTDDDRDRTEMTMRALVGVRPDDLLLEDGDPRSDRMLAVLADLGLTLLDGTIHRRDNDPDDIRDFGCSLLARATGEAPPKPIAPGVVVERPSILQALS